MTLQECTALLVPVALAYRADLDEPTFRAYHRVLKVVPAPVAEAALEALTAAGARFMPSAPEILHASELARRRLLAIHPYEGCADCEAQRGYRSILNAAGQKTVERCPCLARHRDRLEQLGVLSPFASLPGEAGVGESEPVYPTLDQIPSDLRKRLTDVARQKVLR